MVKVALIGYGYWGVNLLRNLTSIKQSEVVLVCDSREERIQAINQTYPGINTTTSFEDVINNDQVEAIVIATPTFSHYELAKRALQAGKHVLVEKPLTATTEQAEELIQLATSKGLQLMVDHTFLYSGAVEYMKELVEGGEIGTLKYFDSTRINLGLLQPDVNVLWDLAPHDISILSFLQKEQPISVNATGVSHTGNGIENIAYMTLNYESGFIAHFNCSWTSPVKLRTTLIGGDKKMIVYDDINPTEKVKIYDTGYECKTLEDRTKIYVDYRVGDISIPKVSTHEPLRKMLEDFLSCIESGNTPVSSWEVGLRTVRILEAAQQSIKQNGKLILIKQ
jgi:predicted dehydrogenase